MVLTHRRQHSPRKCFMVALVSPCSQKSGRQKLIWGREGARGKEESSGDAKLTTLLVSRPAKWSWHASVSSADVTYWTRARGWREAGMPGQGCCRAPAASWHFAVCKWSSSSCLRAGAWTNLMLWPLTEAKVSHGVSLKGWGLLEMIEKLQWVHFFLFPTFLLS